jgi:hypothetical protein
MKNERVNFTAGNGRFNYKYNEGEFSRQKSNATYVLTVDSFKITYKGDFKVLEKNYTKSTNNSNVYQHNEIDFIQLVRGEEARKYEYIYEGEPIGNLFFAKGNVTLTVLNHQFYANPDWPVAVKNFETYSGFQYNNLRELHVALDTYDLISWFSYFYLKKKYQLWGNSLPWGHIDNDPLSLIDSIRVGSGESNFYLALYEKGKKMVGARNKDFFKPYILDFWKKNKLKDFSRIDRCELRITSKGLKTVDIDIGQLTDQRYLIDLFSDVGGNKLVFKKGKNKKSTRDKLIHLIDWNKLQTEKADFSDLNREFRELDKIVEVIKSLYNSYEEHKEDHMLQSLEWYLEEYPDLRSWYHEYRESRN